MDIHQHLHLFYARRTALEPCSSHDEAFAAIAAVLNAVEDEHSGVPRDPSGMPAQTNGRMDPPHTTFAQATTLPGVTVYAQKGHRTYIAEDGAILTANRKPGATELTKPGRAGKGIAL